MTMKKLGALLPTILIVAVIVIGAALAAAGFVYVGLKRPEQRVTISTVLCGDDVVKAYNDAIDGKNSEKIKGIINSFTKGDYKKDPTCVYIALYYNTFIDRNAEKAEEMLGVLGDLNRLGSNPSISLHGLLNMEVVSKIVKYEDKSGTGDNEARKITR